MTPRCTTCCAPRTFGYIALLGLVAFGWPAMMARDAMAKDAAGAQVPSADQRAALDSLDLLLAGCDALLAKVTDVDHRAVTRVFLDSAKKRRDALAKAFEQDAYRDLRLDVNFEYQRLAVWLAPPRSPLRAEKAASTVAANLNGARAHEKALAALDWQIKSLESRASGGSEKKKVAVKAIREHHNELRQKFTKVGFDALLAEMSAFGQERPGETGKSGSPGKKSP
jgi:hypothetical protein